MTVSKNISAFTLVELSIVLVIIGLLVGGVLSGQSLIHASELRSVTTQYGKFITATQTFRGKYFALPGDMTNATSFWGAADGSTGTTAGCAAINSTTTATCNGNGNGIIDIPTGSNEQYRFWQHLANAGLIEGTYTGATTGYAYATTSLNAPQGKFGNSLWLASNFNSFNSTSPPDIFQGIYDNVLEFGLTQSNDDPYGPLLTPADTWNIDAKIDDGMPATGKVVIRHRPTVAGCTDTAVTTNMAANYLLSSTIPACALIFRQAF